MKKTKVLALTLAAATMMMGAGYAYWTDSLTINNTVSTGELNVAFTTANLVSVEKDTKYVEIVTGGEITQDKKSVTFEASNLYPGASLKYNAIFENDGSIPAVIESIGLTNVDKGKITGNGKNNAPGQQKQVDRTKFLVTGNIELNGNVVWSVPVNTTLDNFEANTRAKFENMRLEPEDKVTLDLNIQLDPTLKSGHNQEKVYVTEKFTINFKQHNKTN